MNTKSNFHNFLFLIVVAFIQLVAQTIYVSPTEDDNNSDTQTASVQSFNSTVVLSQSHRNTVFQGSAGMEVGYVPIVKKQEKAATKVRVFILAGQSNMQGYGKISDAENDPNSLEYIIHNDNLGEWSHLGQVGNWSSVNSAWLYFPRSVDTIKSKVTVGHGVNNQFIGPELMFARQLDSFYQEPVLIIKTAIGGTSLAADWRPPSAGGTTGPLYNQMLQTVSNVTQNLPTEFPGIGMSNFEISGFAWFQGWNDGAPTAFTNEYESNLSHLINDVRSAFSNPNLPVVVASAGQGGLITSNDNWVRSIQENIAVAQQNVACNASIYGGSVGFVNTKEFYLPPTLSPDNNEIHHYHNNALTFLNVGKAIGNEMIKAVKDTAFCNTTNVPCSGNGQQTPYTTSIGNRVWNDYNRNGIHDPDEPGIVGVSVALHKDNDGDGNPTNFGGVQVTDSTGQYRFSGLVPGNYRVFVWQVDNWGVGQPLNGFVPTNGHVANANNDVDLDNNGAGTAGQDILSGIVTLTVDGEPLNDGDPTDCDFNFDPAGNNTVDFGFYNPNAPTTNVPCSGHVQQTPYTTSIGNRVWNDLDRDGVHDPGEPGIARVSVALHKDNDGDGNPTNFGGVQVTDSTGQYRFSGLVPGNYRVFVWQVDNWGVGQPLNGFVPTNGHVANANNDVDLDNNGAGTAGQDILSGIVTLTVDGEPLNDGDPTDCDFNFDPAGNNTIDFGFYNPN